MIQLIDVCKTFNVRGVETCVADAFASGRPRERQKKMDELMEVFARFGYVKAP